MKRVLFRWLEAVSRTFAAVTWPPSVDIWLMPPSAEQGKQTTDNRSGP
jgi:hypothetical protein